MKASTKQHKRRYRKYFEDFVLHFTLHRTKDLSKEEIQEYLMLPDNDNAKIDWLKKHHGLLSYRQWITNHGHKDIAKPD